jgi:phosphohistidine phosphatase SixA
VIRHAESERNKGKKNSVYFADDEARKIIKGIPDHKIPLTPEGIAQAEKTGIALRKRFGTFDYIYHSGYLRTTQTMKGILKAWPEKERSKIKIRQNAFCANVTQDILTI